MNIEAIVAHDCNKGISKNGIIPWNIPDDITFFRRTTIKNIVIMGSNTFKSIDYKPLKDRLNIVLTKKPENYFKYSSIYSNLIITDNANIHLDIIRNANEYSSRYFFLNKHFKIFYIGGDSIYKKFAPYCDIVWVTKIKNNYDCDLFFSYDIDNDDTFMPNVITQGELFDIIEYKKVV
jgi:dihydrofolate reductase